MNYKQKLEDLKTSLQEGLDQIEADPVYREKPACVETNAALALIQVSLSSQHRVYVNLLNSLKDEKK